MRWWWWLLIAGAGVISAAFALLIYALCDMSCRQDEAAERVEFPLR